VIALAVGLIALIFLSVCASLLLGALIHEGMRK
jgi:hypothetical protein